MEPEGKRGEGENSNYRCLTRGSWFIAKNAFKTDPILMVDDFDPRAPEVPLATCVASSCAAESGVKPPHST